jgi:hypothetical protein
MGDVKMKKYCFTRYLLIAAIILLLGATPSLASEWPDCPEDLSVDSGFLGYLSENLEEEIDAGNLLTAYDFSGPWAYQPVFASAGHTNLTVEEVYGEEGEFGEVITFSSKDEFGNNYNAWDNPQEIIFDYPDIELKFRDDTKSIDVSISGSHIGDKPGLRFYVSEDGTVYVGFNDVYNDCDFNDMIIAMYPLDNDGDGVRNDEDNCPEVPNEDQADYDSDGVGDECDNCIYFGNEDQLNSDGDSWGDVCDNCPLDDNEDQSDADRDGLGTVCDDSEACPGGDCSVQLYKEEQKIADPNSPFAPGERIIVTSILKNESEQPIRVPIPTCWTTLHTFSVAMMTEEGEVEKILEDMHGDPLAVEISEENTLELQPGQFYPIECDISEKINSEVVRTATQGGEPLRVVSTFTNGIIDEDCYPNSEDPEDCVELNTISASSDPILINIDSSEDGSGSFLDIRPFIRKSRPNTIIRCNWGRLPVGLLSSDTFDATTGDPATFKVAGASVSVKRNGEFDVRKMDINGDGKKDLYFKVNISELTLELGDTVAGFEGRFEEGVLYSTDNVKVLQGWCR